MAVAQLTAGRVKALRPRKTARDVRDASLKVFGIRVQQHSPKRNSPFAISIVAEFGSASGPAFSRQWTMSISPFLDAIGLEVTVCDADAVLGPCWGNSSRADSLVPVPPNACHTHSRVTVVHPSWSGLFHLVRRRATRWTTFGRVHPSIQGASRGQAISTGRFPEVSQADGCAVRHLSLLTSL